MSRLVRCLVFAASVSFSACGPMIAPPCGGDSDCEGILVCVSGVCVVPDPHSRPDAGRAVVDAGEVSDAGSVDAGSVEMDAGSPCTPGVETCNGIDDDCDGIIDNFPILTALDGGSVAFDGGVASVNGVCTVGVGACANNGMTACMSGSLACSAMPHAPGVERCNLIDDDCDGQTDENEPGVCSVTGQLCTSGSCACPSGQSVCNGACKTLTTEVCDGIDNDCDGQTDEGVTITCLADPDGDGYATGAASSEQCADPARPAQGQCPTGFVAPSSSLGTDCNAADGMAWRLMSSRADGDTDGYCQGNATDDCVGTSALAGRRFASTCNPSDDCDDTNSARYRNVLSRNDGDGDGYCSGSVANDCTGANPLPGRRFSSTCAATDDCNDASGSIFRFASTRGDADQDGFCVGNATNECIGTNPPAGRRYTNLCTVLPFETMSYDCDDTQASRYTMQAVRADADGDTYCAGVPQMQCLGATAPAGMRFSGSCTGEDCRDTNAYATTTCTIAAGYRTTAALKQCGVGFPAAITANVSVTQNCPAGFSYVYGQSSTATAYSGDPGGSCSVNSPTQVALTCNQLVLGQFTCSIVGSCVAN